ncbi:MAG: PASTA domain-containing protein [Clostridia bacterium]|nr:PASTA domain-containing protein [Clostridia bacterium]
MPHKVRRFSHKRRISCFITIFMLCFAVLIGNLFRWQIIEAEELQRKALGQWTSTTVVSASRGSIYDKNGEILAVSGLSKSLVVKPSVIKKEGNANQVADSLSSVLGLDRESVYAKVCKTEYAEVTIKRHLSDAEIKAVEAIGSKGVVLVDDKKRYYPKGATLAQVLGSTAVDGTGKEGLELKYDKYLRGLTGKIYSSADVWGSQIPGGEERYVDPTNGLNLRLTIDYNIQKFAESAMRKCMTEQKAKKVTCIVMEPNTGEVLAMVNLPDYDLNDPPKSDWEAWSAISRNGAILDAYEPGSTFKVLTLAAALQEGKVTKTSTFYDPGYHMVDGEKIKCWRTVPHGSQTLAQAVQNSCNTAFMQMGLMLGTEKMYEYLRAFGIGSQTGVDFSADQSGIMLAQKYVRNVDLARISFGQAIAVTPLQLITAFSAAINGGELMQPHLVGALVDDDGKVVTENKPVVVRRVISEQTSATVRELLESVVSQGSGKNAYIPGYKVGGKTGTAQKYKDGKIVRDTHIASFIGFAPADDPRIAVLVVVDEPDVAIDYGSVVAAPYVKIIMEQSLKYMKVPADNADKDEHELIENIEVPNLRGLDCVEAEKKLKELGLYMLVQGKGKVIAQVPAAGTMVYKGASVLVTGGTAVDSYTDVME